MNHISLAWGQATRTIQQQLTSFNSPPLLTPQKVKAIQDVVSQEIMRLQNLREQLESRQQELNRTCSPRLNSTRSLWLATIGSGVSSLCGITATYFTLFSESTAAKTTACAFASLSIFTSWGATFYVNKIALINQELAQLAALQTKGEEHAIKFKDFLDKLYQTMLLQQSPDTRSFDTEITTCLQYYEQLPVPYKSEKGFASTVSSLVLGLPATDPLKSEFITLDTHRFQKIASLADKEEVRLHYLPSSKEEAEEENLDSLEHKNFRRKPLVWDQGEEGGDTTFGMSHGSLPLNPIPDYNEKLTALKEAIQRRFKIQSSIPYLLSGIGCRLDSQQNTPAPTRRKLEEVVVQMETT